MTTAWRSALARAPRWSIPVMLAATGAFVMVAALVMLDTTDAADLGVTRAFQSVASDPLDVVVNAHTLVGQLAITLPLSVLVALVAQRRLGGWAWLGPLFMLATGGIELVLKYVVQHPGPPREFIRAFIDPLGIPPELRPPHSFPSGHLARLTFLSIVLASLFPSRLAWIAAGAFVAFTLYARVYIGDHWLSDALGGLTLGAAVAGAAVIWMRAMGSRRPEGVATAEGQRG